MGAVPDWRRPDINALTFVVMGGTFVVNLGVVIYERRAGGG